MKVNKKGELENIRRYHYVFLGFSKFEDVYEKLQSLLKFYRFEYAGNSNAKEVIYDVPDDLLSSSGLVLSKQFEDGKIMFNVRKLSFLPGAKERPSKKFLLGELEADEEPKDFSLEISSAIENSFTTSFSVDLDSIVKQTMPKIEIIIKAKKYKIIGGTGFRGYLIYENAIYKDIKSGKKVSRLGITLQFSASREWEEENKKILDIIEREVKELALYNVSRFEIAQKLLYSAPLDEDEETEDEE